jgi:hypothetical protein
MRGSTAPLGLTVIISSTSFVTAPGTSRAPAQRGVELEQRLLLELARPLRAQPQLMADLLQRPRRPVEAEVRGDDGALSFRQAGEGLREHRPALVRDCLDLRVGGAQVREELGHRQAGVANRLVERDHRRRQREQLLDGGG